MRLPVTNPGTRSPRFFLWEGFPMSRGRFVCRIALLPLALCAAPQARSTAHTTPAPAPQSVASSPGLRPEVRLRKLHLVRPDLIQYPLAFEVYC
jgi:hypothetical protein